MTLSKPAKVVKVMARLSPEEKANLDRMAQDCDITLSLALREGARLYLEELSKEKNRMRDQMRIRVSS